MFCKRNMSIKLTDIITCQCICHFIIHFTFNVKRTCFINERYYIHKTRPFYVEGKMYYEVTYTLASDNVSKFDRHIAFTEHSLLENYALELSLRKEAIHIMGTTMPVDIIEDW